MFIFVPALHRVVTVARNKFEIRKQVLSQSFLRIVLALGFPTI